MVATNRHTDINMNIIELIKYTILIFLDALRPSSEPFERRANNTSKLSSQIEEEPDLLDVPKHKEETRSLKSTNNSPSTPKKNDKEHLFSVFKNFRKGKLSLIN